jgi:PAS domain S-box-containing protein
MSGVAAFLTLFLTQCFPAFNPEGVLLMAGIVVVALIWGVGPSLLATLVGAWLLVFVVLPPHFSWQLQDPSKWMEILVLLLGGGGISVLASQSARGRQRAEALAARLAEAKVRHDLERLRLRALVDALPVPVALVDAQERVLESNPACQRLFLGEAAPRPREIADFEKANAWWPATGQRVSPRTFAIARAALTGERVTNEEVEIETADGQRKIVLDSATPIWDERAALQGAVGVLQDITERKRLEEALRQAEQEAEARARELEAIFEALADGLLVYDAEGHILRTNIAARQILGLEAHLEFAALPLQERAIRYALRDEQGHPIPTEDSAPSQLVHGKVLTSKEAAEHCLQTPDGREVFISLTGRPLRTAAGAISGAVAIVRDVTERRRLEREVTEGAAQLNTIFESIADGVIVTDRQRRVLHMNQAARTLLLLEPDPTGFTIPELEGIAGFSARNAQGQPLTEAERPITRYLQGEVLTRQQSVNLILQTRDGKETLLNNTGAPVRDTTGHIIGGVEVIRDVTEQRRLEHQTHETLTALLAMAEALVRAPDTGREAAADVAPPGNQVARRLAELTRSVLQCQYVGITAVEPGTLKLTPTTLVGGAPEHEQQWCESLDEQSRLGQHVPPGAVAALQAGEPVLVKRLQTAVPTGRNLAPGCQSVLVPMRMGDTLVGLLRVEGGTTEEADSHPQSKVLLSAVAKLGALVLERERLLRERAEAQANEMALRAANAQMDTFLGMVGHELKTPLTSLKLALQLAERRGRHVIQRQSDEAGDVAPLLELSTRAVLQADRLDRLVNDLLDVSRVQAGKLEFHPAAADLAAMVREAVEEQRQANPARALLVQFPADLSVVVTADADRLGQVVTNYLTNALKYSPADRPVAAGLDLDEGQMRVWVRDQGPGIPPEEQERIWDRFHRVKGVEVQSGIGVGLGLGLHICRTIIERHQGQVGVESVPGQGSTFWFTLPLSSQE